MIGGLLQERVCLEELGPEANLRFSELATKRRILGTWSNRLQTVHYIVELEKPLRQCPQGSCVCGTT